MKDAINKQLLNPFFTDLTYRLYFGNFLKLVNLSNYKMSALLRATTLATLSGTKMAVRLPPQATVASSRSITSREWREKHNRFRNRLNDLPDWSYTDGRGYGPPSAAQKRRYLADQELGQTVVRRIKEMQEAKKFQ